MDNAELKQVFDSINDLLEEATCMAFFDSVVFDYVVEELTAACIFHD